VECSKQSFRRERPRFEFFRMCLFMNTHPRSLSLSLTLSRSLSLSLALSRSLSLTHTPSLTHSQAHTLSHTHTQILSLTNTHHTLQKSERLTLKHIFVTQSLMLDDIHLLPPMSSILGVAKRYVKSNLARKLIKAFKDASKKKLIRLHIEIGGKRYAKSYKSDLLISDIWCS